MLDNLTIPEIKGGLALVKKSLPLWRVVEKRNIISCYKEFSVKNTLFLVRLSIDGMNVFIREKKLMSTKDFPCPSDAYKELQIGEVRIDGSYSFTDFAFDKLFESNEEVFKECKKALLFLGRFYISKLNLDKVKK